MSHKKCQFHGIFHNWGKATFYDTSNLLVCDPLVNGGFADGL